MMKPFLVVCLFAAGIQAQERHIGLRPAAGSGYVSLNQNGELMVSPVAGTETVLLRNREFRALAALPGSGEQVQLMLAVGAQLYVCQDKPGGRVGVTARGSGIAMQVILLDMSSGTPVMRQGGLQDGSFVAFRALDGRFLGYDGNGQMVLAAVTDGKLGVGQSFRIEYRESDFLARQAQETERVRQDEQRRNQDAAERRQVFAEQQQRVADEQRRRDEAARQERVTAQLAQQQRDREAQQKRDAQQAAQKVQSQAANEMASRQTAKAAVVVAANQPAKGSPPAYQTQDKEPPPLAQVSFQLRNRGWYNVRFSIAGVGSSGTLMRNQNSKEFYLNGSNGSVKIEGQGLSGWFDLRNTNIQGLGEFKRGDKICVQTEGTVGALGEQTLKACQ